MRMLYLVRHGETAWNRSKVFRGRADIALSEVGLQQAGRAAQVAARLKLERVFASPLKRCQQTAQAIGDTASVPIQTLEDLIDVDYGDWTGRPDQDVAKADRELYAQYHTAPQAVTFPRGESLRQVQARATTAVDAALALDWQTAAIVAHRVVLKLILMTWLGMPLARFWSIRLDPCGLSAVHLSAGQWTVWLVNDTHHLQGMDGAAYGDF